VKKLRTPRNILQHELIGLHCSVVRARNASQIGIEGKIIDETMKMITVESGGERKMVEKAGSAFRLRLDDAVVEVEGDALLARPEDRVKKIVTRW
jgi:ribonuclease P protein subunit POP4